ncbi:MAG: phosphotransferase family protein [Dehalococcoidia bacterium]|nr:phosphotransferase family protein [Dehalococcoidia bacterium]
MTTTDVPSGINYDNVSRFFAEHIEGGAVPLTFKLIGDGRSNLTYLVTGGGRRWVLRRPPLGHVLPTAHDMVREYRVLAGLANTDVPVPHPVALCEDTAVNDYPFYVMEYREGVIIVNELPEGFATTPQERRAISIALVDTLVKLHAVDYNAVGLGDFGRPEGYLERQVRRWSEQWERSKTRELPEIDELIRRLKASIPESPAPTIVHGDYRLGNMALDPNDPGKVVAIFDWEMSTLGDPLSDLGYTLVYWGNLADSEEKLNIRPNARVTAQEGFLTREELVEEYARRSGRNVQNIDWYEVFANYKLAVIVEGIYARHLQGKTVGGGFEGYDQTAPRLVNVALEQASRSANPKLRGE